MFPSYTSGGPIKLNIVNFDFRKGIILGKKMHQTILFNELIIHSTVKFIRTVSAETAKSKGMDASIRPGE